MNKQKALEKIKKCLALSKSANEHEAAQALKQAQALMRLHQIDGAVRRARTRHQSRAIAAEMAMDAGQSVLPCFRLPLLS